MNQYLKKGISFVLVLGLFCSILGCPVLAAKENNIEGLTFSASLTKEFLEVSEQPQTVTVTVKANTDFSTDGIGFVVDSGEFEILSIENHDFQTNGNVWNASTDNGIVTSVTSDAENTIVGIIAEVTIQIPANYNEGTYAIGIKEIVISRDYGMEVESGAEAYAEVTIGKSPLPPEDDSFPNIDTPVHENCPSAKFTDVDQDLWYHDGIDYVIDNGLMNGVGDTLFAPNGTTNRAMIVTILHRLEGTPGGETPSFQDVAEGQWYSEAVGWAAANGIVTGYSADTFGPMNPITREQLAAILYRYADYCGYDLAAGEDTNILSYVDAMSISEYAVTPMQWAVGEGLINGVEGNALAPKGTATRAQVATILMRFCENVAN